MSEDMKLFGEVGLGYSQLQQDATEINKLINSIDQQAQKLSQTLKKSDVDLDVKMDDKSAKVFASEMQKAMGIINNGSTEAHKHMTGITKDFQEVNKRVEKTAKQIDSLNSSIGKMNQSGIKNSIISDTLPKDIQNVKKQLVELAQEQSRIFSGNMSTKDMVAVHVKSLKNAKEGTLEWRNSLNNVKNAMNVVNAELEAAYQKQIQLANAAKSSNLKDGSFPINSPHIGKTFSFEKMQADAKKLNAEIDNFGGKTFKYGQKFQMTMQRSGHEIRKVFKEMGQGSNRFKVTGLTGVYKDTKRINAETRKVNAEYRKLISSANQLDRALDKVDAPKQPNPVNANMTTMAELYAIRQGFTMINNEILNFERNQIEVERIARNTTKEAKNLVQATFDISKNTGVMVDKTQEVAALWARTGKSGEQLKSAMETTVMGFNVAEFKDAETAVASLNAIINQMYNGDATQAQSILDSMVKVADKTAVRNVEDLAEVASRAGSNAATLNMSLHELNSVSSIIMENMKINGETLGTQLRNIFSRMLNEKNINKLRGLGVEMTNIAPDGTQQYKNFEEAMDGVVSKYKQLVAMGDEVGANKILEIIGGARQIATLKNLVNNWDQYDERVKLSMDSQGFAAEQNEKMMESYSKKVEQLKVSLTELAVSMGEGGIIDMLKMMSDGTRGLVESFRDVPNEIKAVLASFLGLSIGLAGLFKLKELFTREGSIFSMLTSGLSMFVSQGKVTEGAMTAMIGKTKVLIPSFGEGTSAIGKFFTAMKTGTVTVGTMTASLGATVGVIGGVVVALGALIYAYNKMQKERQEAIDSFMSGSGEKELDDIKKLKSEYDKLLSNKDSMVEGTEAYDKMADVNDRLHNALKMTNNAVQTSSASMEANTNLIKLKTQIMERELELQNDLAQAEMKRRIEGAKNAWNPSSLNSQLNRLGDRKAEMDYANQTVKGALTQEIGIKRAEDAQRRYNKTLLEAIDNYSVLVGYADKLGMSQDELDNMLISAGLGEQVKLLKDEFEGVSESSDGAVDGIQSIEDAAADAQKEVEELTKALDGLNSSVNALESARAEYDKEGFLSPETISKLIAQLPEAANHIENIGGKWVLTTGYLDLFNKKTAEQNELLEETIMTAREMTNSSYDGAMITAGNLIDADSLNDIQNTFSSFSEEVKGDISDINESMANGAYSVDEYFSALSEAINGLDLSKLSTTQIDGFSAAIRNQLSNGIAALNNQLKQGSLSQADYANKLSATKDKALSLYSTINGLSNIGGVWKNAAGDVDEFAQSIENLDGSAGAVDSNLIGISNALEGVQVSFNEAGDAILGFGENALILEDFSGSFIENMENIRSTNETLWIQIVQQVATALGITQEQAVQALQGVSIAGVSSQEVMNAALNGLINNLSSSISASANSTVDIVNQLQNKIAGINIGVKAKIERGSDVPISLGSIMGIPITGSLRAGWGFDVKSDAARNLGMNPIRTASATMASNAIHGITPFKQVGNFGKMDVLRKANPNNKMLQNFDKEFGIFGMGMNPSLSTQALNNGTIMANDYKQATTFAASYFKNKANSHSMQMMNQDAIKEAIKSAGTGEPLPRGGSGTGGGGGSKGKSSKEEKEKKPDDIPEKIQKQIDDLKHKLEMDELSQYEYGKELERIFDKNKNLLTDKGIREMEKMIYDAKTGGSKEDFQAQIDSLESIIDMADVAIEALEVEQKMYDTIGMNPMHGVDIQLKKMDLLSAKIVANEAISRKYKLAIEAIDKEIGSLDSSSIGYTKTVEQLTFQQNELKQKLMETKKEISQMTFDIFQANVTIAKLKNEEFKKAISAIEENEQKMVDYINHRNDQIKEKVQERHKEELETLEKQNEARDKNHQKEMKRMQKESDKFREMMEDKLKMLNRQYETDDYDDNVRKKNDEIKKIEMQINELSMDDSYKAKGQVIKLTEDLNSKKEELARIQKERERTIVQEGINDQLTEHDRLMQEKQAKMDEESQLLQEKQNNEMELLRQKQEAEMKALEETMTAKAVYIEAEKALTTGLVNDVNGKAIGIRDAVISYMQDMGQGSGILKEKIIQDITEIQNALRNAMQMTGTGGLEGRSELQQRTGLTDQEYQRWISDTAGKFGMVIGEDDVEGYIMNKIRWGESSTPEEKARYAEANHLIRQGLVDRLGQGANKDRNGEVVSLSQIFKSIEEGKYMKAQTSPKFSPLQGVSTNLYEQAANLWSQKSIYPGSLNTANSALSYLHQINPALKNFVYEDYYGKGSADTLNSLRDAALAYGNIGSLNELIAAEQWAKDKAAGQSVGGNGSTSGMSDSQLSDEIKRNLSSNLSQEQRAFIEKLIPGAIQNFRKHGILPSVTIGQAIHESNWGKSGLTQKANALFGIKVGSSWSGASVNMSTKEHVNGSTVTQKDNFRAYGSLDESIADFGNLIGNSSRYSGAKSQTTPTGQLGAIKKGGYATDPNYVGKVSNIINKYGLGNIDSAAARSSYGEQTDTDNGYEQGNQNSPGRKVLSKAKTAVGKPYTWGGTDPFGNGSDCSGFTDWAYTQAGYDIPGRLTSSSLVANPGSHNLREIPRDQMQPGDVLWRSGHVGMLLDVDGSTIEANGKRGEVRGNMGGRVKIHGAGRVNDFAKIYRYKGFNDGGIADFTGTAMLHGTKTSPEYIFNTPQFEALGKLVAHYAKMPSVTAPSVNTGNIQPMQVINIGNLLNVEGNLDEKVLPEVKVQTANALEKLKKALNKRGV